MKLTMICKEERCGETTCPSIYLAENGEFVIQGRVLDGATSKNLLNVGEGESAVSISAAILLKAVEAYRAKG